MNSRIISKNNHIITIACIGVFVSSIVLYMYFVSLSVTHVVTRRETLHNLNEVKSQIAQLETLYIEARHKINTELANADGFNENNNKIFITRSEQSFVLRGDQ